MFTLTFMFKRISIASPGNDVHALQYLAPFYVECIQIKLAKNRKALQYLPSCTNPSLPSPLS